VFLCNNNINRINIKPQNILIKFLDNGNHVYKINNFKYAREIDYNDSPDYDIKGTEKYLDQPILERKLIKAKVFNRFAASPDLEFWSLGATIYQVVTGKLPIDISKCDKLFEESKRIIQTKLPKTCLIPEILHEDISSLFFNLFKYEMNPNNSIINNGKLDEFFTSSIKIRSYHYLSIVITHNYEKYTVRIKNDNDRNNVLIQYVF
jgi:hypothetical protein